MPNNEKILFSNGYSFVIDDKIPFERFPLAMKNIVTCLYNDYKILNEYLNIN